LNNSENILIKKLAKEFEFDVCRVTDPKLDLLTELRLKEFIDLGFHGEMKWMEETYERRRSPINLWSEAKSAIILGLNYGPGADPLIKNDNKSMGNISVYAQGKDYHGVIKGRLKSFSSKLIARLDKINPTNVKVFVDTAPLMEKPLAEKSGIGWQGKHTNLVSREFGSWLFLGVILVNKVFQYDNPESNHCGSCNQCIKICPTNAFDAPYKLNATKCISYLTIEHAGPVDLNLRDKLGNHIYGCDDCLAVCPWNKFAKEAADNKYHARDDLLEPDLDELVILDDFSFRKKFSGSPIKRIGRDRFIRNVLYAIGNSHDKKYLDKIDHLVKDPNPVVADAAQWAKRELKG